MVMKDFITWAGGWAAEQLGSTLGVILMVAAGLAWVAHLEWNGALKEKGPDRTALIGFLRRGGSWRWRYVRLVEYALDRLDRLMGDGGRASRACQWVTGRGPAYACWSGMSFDRCALLVVVYPVLSTWLIWAVTGQVHEIGRLLDFHPGANWLVRLALIVILLLLYGLYRLEKVVGLPLLYRLHYCAGVVAGGFAFTPTGSVIAAATVLGGAVGAGAGASAVAVVGAVAFLAAFAAVGAAAAVVGVTVTDPDLLVILLVYALFLGQSALVAFAAACAARPFYNRGQAGRFWAIAYPLAIIVIYGQLWILGLIGVAPAFRLLLTLLGLVALLNLPFGWFSIGATRGLLRCCCRPAGHPALPFLYSLANLGIGLVLLVVLIITLALGLQAADAIVWHASQEHLINVPELLSALRNDPASPQHWWIYVTLFSTLIPSALNLLLGTISLTFVSQPSSRLDLIRRIRRLTPTGRESTRFRISVRLMLPVFFGATLAGLIL